MTYILELKKGYFISRKTGGRELVEEGLTTPLSLHECLTVSRIDDKRDFRKGKTTEVLRRQESSGKVSLRLNLGGGL